MTRRNWPTSTSKRKKKRNVVRTQLVDALFLPKEITASTRIEAISEILYTSHIPNASNVICPETMTKYKKDRIFVTLCMSEKERNQSLRRNTTNNLPGYRHWSHGERCCHSQAEKKSVREKVLLLLYHTYESLGQISLFLIEESLKVLFHNIQAFLREGNHKIPWDRVLRRCVLQIVQGLLAFYLLIT